jgi:hypothetical protein
VQKQFADSGELIGYDLLPALFPYGTNALRRDDEIKHRLRMSGQDPHKLTFEQRQRLVLSGSENGDKPDAAHSWTPVDLLKLAAEPPEPPTIGGLVYPGRRHIFSGEPETLKTWAGLILAAAEILAGGTALYVDLEMGAREHLARLRDLGLTDEQVGRFLYIAPAEPVTSSRVTADVAELLARRNPSLVVFDSFTGALDVHGFDPDKGVQVERFYRTVVRPFQDHGAAVVLLDHVTKAKDTRARYSIASERKLGGADVHLGFEIVRPFGRGKSGLAKIKTHKDRPGYLPRPVAAELELTSDAGDGRVSWEIKMSEAGDSRDPFRPTVLMERVSRYVGNCKGERQSRNQVEKAVKGQGHALRRAIDCLVDEGFFTEEAGPKGARLLGFVKLYTEARDDD